MCKSIFIALCRFYWWYIDDDLAWRLLKSKMHSPRCLCQIEKQSYKRPIFNAHNFERTLVALESSPVPFLPWTLSMNLGGPFPPKLGIIRFHSGQCPTKKNWLVFGLVPCMFFTDMLQFLWWLGSLPSSPKASCSEICSWNDKLMIWFIYVCIFQLRNLYHKGFLRY